MAMSRNCSTTLCGTGTLHPHQRREVGDPVLDREIRQDEQPAACQNGCPIVRRSRLIVHSPELHQRLQLSGGEDLSEGLRHGPRKLFVALGGVGVREQDRAAEVLTVRYRPIPSNGGPMGAPCLDRWQPMQPFSVSSARGRWSQ